LKGGTPLYNIFRIKGTTALVEDQCRMYVKIIYRGMCTLTVWYIRHGEQYTTCYAAVAGGIYTVGCGRRRYIFADGRRRYIYRAVGCIYIVGCGRRSICAVGCIYFV